VCLQFFPLSNGRRWDWAAPGSGGEEAARVTLDIHAAREAARGRGGVAVAGESHDRGLGCVWR
jgi:hypothetical protein